MLRLLSICADRDMRIPGASRILENNSNSWKPDAFLRLCEARNPTPPYHYKHHNVCGLLSVKVDGEECWSLNWDIEILLFWTLCARCSEQTQCTQRLSTFDGFWRGNMLGKPSGVFPGSPWKSRIFTAWEWQGVTRYNAYLCNYQRTRRRM